MSTETKYLDLDSAVPAVNKKVLIDGVEYTFKEPSVEDFSKEIARLTEIRKRLDQIKKSQGEDEAAASESQLMLDVMIDGIKQAFPDMPPEVLNKLSMARIHAIRQFIQDEITENAEDETGQRLKGAAVEEVDFGLLFCRVMHFYSLPYRDARDLPLRTFWLMSRSINRISAEQDLRHLQVAAAAQSADGFRDINKRLQEEIDQKPIEQSAPAEDEPAGMERMHQFMQKLRKA